MPMRPKLVTSVKTSAWALEVVYDYDAIRARVSRASIEAGPTSIWRYRDFLPIEGDPIDVGTGFTPLLRANRLARRLGLKELYIKNDGVNMPTLSFKDRVVSVALTRARELGFSTVSCASTGNLANSTAAIAAHAGLEAACSFQPIWKLENPRHLGLQPHLDGGSRQLRPGQPSLLGGGEHLRLGLRQHQPAPLLPEVPRPWL